MSNPLRIFVSHSHQDNEFGLKLVEDLRGTLGSQATVWYDISGGLAGGDAWWSRIVDELSNSHVLIVIVSPDSMASKWVNDEIDLAWMQKNSAGGKRIIPVQCRDCEMRQDLRTRQVISFLPGIAYRHAFEELITVLKAESVRRTGVNLPQPKPPVETGGLGISLRGTGQDVSSLITLKEGLSLFRLTHEGARNFGVWLLDEQGERVSLLANARGRFDGGTAIGISESGKYLLDVSADGAWSVTIEQPRQGRFNVTRSSSFQGTGQQFSPIFELRTGAVKFRLTHEGTGHFGVWLLDEHGQRVSLLANAPGRFDGAKVVGIKHPGPHILDISAHGNWTVNIESVR